MSKSSQPMQVSVIIPARDEASSIGRLILKIRESLSGCLHEIITVDRIVSQDLGHIIPGSILRWRIDCGD